MRRFFLILCPIFCYLSTAAQKNGSIKGAAVDTAMKQTLSNATITLMQKKDSSLVSFTMTDNNGRFELTGLQNGDYRLLITHVNYHNSYRTVTIDDGHKNIDLGVIFMNDRSKVLSRVIVSSEAPPVTLLGDTVQYDAGSYKTVTNASVEELLKKLPGIKVDKD